MTSMGHQAKRYQFPAMESANCSTVLPLLLADARCAPAAAQLCRPKRLLAMYSYTVRLASVAQWFCPVLSSLDVSYNAKCSSRGEVALTVVIAAA